jgi:hypothetical protein
MSAGRSAASISATRFSSDGLSRSLGFVFIEQLNKKPTFLIAGPHGREQFLATQRDAARKKLNTLSY